MRFPASTVLPLLMTCVTASAGEEVIKDSQGMDCFVYTPDPVDDAKTKDKPGSAKLLEQCKNSAEIWLAAAKANGRWKGKDKEDFLRHSQGLGIETDG